MSELYVIVGLGNPGNHYEKTRHNMGFRVVDRLARDWSISVNQVKWKALVGQGQREGHKVLLVKPQTYMNLSGQAVQAIQNFYKLDPGHLIVVYDDIDIELGTIRVKGHGSAGSHNGMKSIVSSLSTTDFPRIRLAVGRRMASQDLADFVLSTFTPEEEKVVEDEVGMACRAIETILDQGVEAAMNQVNGWISDRLPKPTNEEEKERINREKARRNQEAFIKEAKRCGEK